MCMGLGVSPEHVAFFFLASAKGPYAVTKLNRVEVDRGGGVRGQGVTQLWIGSLSWSLLQQPWF